MPMEYFEHGDLRNHISLSLTEWDAKILAYQLLDGLKVLHSQDWLHHDLKPENIFVVRPAPRWWVKIGDFGISKRITERGPITSGTSQYMAPEAHDIAFEEGGHQRFAIDIWALGCILYEVLTQFTPIPSDKIAGYVKGEISFSTKPLISKKVSEGGVSMIASLLAPKPAARPTAAEALQSSWVSRDRREALIDLRGKGFDLEGNHRFDAWNAIRYASKLGSRDGLYLVLDKGIDVNTVRIADGCTALHNVIRAGNEHALRMLVDNGADVNKAVARGTGHAEGMRPLHFAVARGSALMVKLLLERGADINIRDRDGHTPITLGIADNDEDRLAAMSALLNAGADLQIPNNKGVTALHVACFQGAPQVVELLLEAGADANTESTIVNPVKPLDYAMLRPADAAREKIVELLQARGGQPKISEKGAVGGDDSLESKKEQLSLPIVKQKTSFSEEKGPWKQGQGCMAEELYSAAGHSEEVLTAFLKETGASINVGDADLGRSALYLAARDGVKAAVRNLLDQGADAGIQDDTIGIAPLHLAAKNGHYDIATLLLERGADIEITKANGERPLHLASESGHESMVYLLVERGADINARTKRGWTPYLYAHTNEDPGGRAVVQFLESKGVQKSAEARIFGLVNRTMSSKPAKPKQP